MDVLLHVNIFRYYLILKLHYRHNSDCKKLFLSACYNWNDKVSLRELDQKFQFGGPIGYGNYYLDSVLCYSKVFTLHARLHDAAGAVRSHTGKRPGCGFMIGQGPNSRLLGHVTGFFFCLYIKIIVHSIFNSLDL